jgi:hypothetical protein
VSNQQEKLAPKDVMTRIGQLWKALSDEEKKEWNEKGAEDKVCTIL